MKKLVIGATGNVGKYVVRELIDKGCNVKCGSTNPNKAKNKFPELDVEWVKFDFTDKTTFDILSDCDSVFFVRPPSLGDPKVSYSFIDELSKLHGLHVVFMSLMGVESNPIPPHAKIEKYIKVRCEKYTFVRPGFFMENLVYPHGEDIKKLDKLIVPALKSKTSFIAAEDIGIASSIIMYEGSKHFGKAYTLTGDKAYSYYDVAEIMTSVLGRKIEYTNPSMRRYQNHMIGQRNLSPDYVKITKLLYLMTRLGTAKKVTSDLNELKSGSAISLKNFISNNKVIWM